ncbi:C40 family peptidase [Sinobaca sp. H24]|uniref:C40 family peptidase n=1 Tax=Sinobaca sp. H24 TaxID=2923376 RepID=UPI002079A37F|nr:C40 family peptidase [Sinobaca sp. H24]
MIRILKLTLFFCAVSLLIAAPAQAEKESLTKGETAYVDVSVVTVWAEPDILRPVDAPSASNPVSPRIWTDSMTLDDKLWLVGNLETQALYGMKVTILDEQGDWVKIAVHGQSTPREETGYPGWVPKEQLSQNKKFEAMQKKSFAQINVPTAVLYDDPQLTSEALEVSFNTRLPVIAEQNGKILTASPSGKNKWISAEDAEIYDSEKSIPYPTSEDLIETGKTFLDLPYLWAGVSGFGYDCSGFTHSVYKAHGIEIPRDSGVQAEAGEFIERENLQKGDLVFFAREEGTGTVHHVGMYIEDDVMIHSPNSRSTVEITTISESAYADSYHSGRRYLK